MTNRLNSARFGDKNDDKNGETDPSPTQSSAEEVEEGDGELTTLASEVVTSLMYEAKNIMKAFKMKEKEKKEIGAQLLGQVSHRKFILINRKLTCIHRKFIRRHRKLNRK